MMLYFYLGILGSVAIFSAIIFSFAVLPGYRAGHIRIPTEEIEARANAEQERYELALEMANEQNGTNYMLRAKRWIAEHPGEEKWAENKNFPSRPIKLELQPYRRFSNETARYDQKYRLDWYEKRREEQMVRLGNLLAEKLELGE